MDDSYGPPDPRRARGIAARSGPPLRSPAMPNSLDAARQRSLDHSHSDNVFTRPAIFPSRRSGAACADETPDGPPVHRPRPPTKPPSQHRATGNRWAGPCLRLGPRCWRTCCPARKPASTRAKLTTRPATIHRFGFEGFRPRDGRYRVTRGKQRRRIGGSDPSNASRTETHRSPWTPSIPWIRALGVGKARGEFCSHRGKSRGSAPA